MRYIFLLFLCLTVVVSVNSQTVPEEKIPIELTVPGLPNIEMDILYKEREAYLPVVELFEKVGIRSSFDSVDNKLQGCVRDPDSAFVIDVARMEGHYKDRAIMLTPQDYIIRDGVFYAKVGILNSLFSYGIKYNPRQVSLEIKNWRALPGVMSVMRRRNIESALARRKIPAPDLYLERLEGYCGSRLDYILSSDFINRFAPRFRYTTTFGSKLFYSDFTMKVYGNSYTRISNNNIRAQIRYPFLNTSVVKQIIGGDYITNGILPTQVFGFELTNRPYAQRFFFSREIFHGQFEPSADVTLAGGAEGVQTVSANESGEYQFDSPIVYGQGTFEVQAFDFFGREQKLRYKMNVPITLVPPGEVEYSISGGKMHSPKDRYIYSNYFNWGVNSDITIGAKLDYFDFPTPNRVIPAITATTRITSGLSFYSLVSPSALSRVGTNWFFPSGALISILGTHFARSSYFNPANLVDDLDLNLSIPTTIRQKLFYINGSVAVTNALLTRQRQVQFSVGYPFGGLSPRFSSILSWQDSLTGNFMKISHLTMFSVGLFLPAGFVLQSDISYNHINRNLESISARLSKQFLSGLQASLSYFRFSIQSAYVLGFQLRYLLPFVNVQSGVTKQNVGDYYTYTTLVSGSAGLDPKKPSFYFDNLPSYTGFGGLNVRPFIDANSNGIMDEGEEEVSKANVLLANVTRLARPIGVRYDISSLRRLLSYEEYDVYLDPQSLEDPLWVPMRGTLRFLSEPNTFRSVDIPLVNGGTVHGTVLTVKEGVKVPMEGISLLLQSTETGRTQEKKIYKTGSTFSTGEYEFALLPPGKYKIEIDPKQLQSMGYRSQPPFREFEINAVPSGDVVEKIDFELLGR